MDNRPIYRRIEELVQREGRLPKDFQVEEREHTEGELRFAPGAMEGILSHHSTGKWEKAAFIQTLKKYVKMPLGQALQDFEINKADQFQTATMRANLLREIISHRVELEPDKVANLAYCFVANGRKAETVKLGLTMLSLFNFSGNPQVCHMLQILGYCEDFTDYVLMNVENWEEPQKQECYFSLAKSLHGWGKINVVEMMEADTEEKKQWILCHGCKNSVMNAYLGLVCAQKADLYGRLQTGKLSAEELLGAMEIMNGLLDEGPCAGMSDLEQPVELTLLYLEEVEQVLKAGNTEDAVIYAAQLSSINDYFAESEKEDSAKVCTKIQEIVEALDADELLAEGLKTYTWECLQVAKMCNKDIGQPLMQLIKEDFPKYFRYCHHFLQTGLWAEEFLTLCEERIDENVYDKGMGNHMGLKLKAGQVPVDMVVQYLDRYPLQGQKLIEICMDSPIIRWRLMAGKALLGWVEMLNKPLSQIVPDLYSKVMTLHIIESNANAKEQWSKLI